MKYNLFFLTIAFQFKMLFYKLHKTVSFRPTCSHMLLIV